MLIFPLEMCKILKGGMNSSSKGVQNNCMVLLELTFGIGSLKAALILAYRYRTFRPLMLMKLSGNKKLCHFYIARQLEISHCIFIFEGF